jgi:hypothetical protein
LDDIQHLLLNQAGFVADADDEVAFGHKCLDMFRPNDSINFLPYTPYRIRPELDLVKAIIAKGFREIGLAG